MSFFQNTCVMVTEESDFAIIRVWLYGFQKQMYEQVHSSSWRRTAEEGAEHFMAKWIAAEKAKAGLRHAVVCPNVTRRTKKRIA